MQKWNILIHIFLILFLIIVKKSGLVDLNSEVVKGFDGIIILTDHTNVDYELIKNNASLIIDTRNVYPLNNDKNIFRLGVGKSE
jgi:UDP-N-acetyl-D-mannosaminuronate dehydrogenase